MFEPAAEPVQSPDHERVAGGEELEAGVELGAVFERPGADVVKHAAAAGWLERVELQREVLLVGGDARVADQVALLVLAHRFIRSYHGRDRSKTLGRLHAVGDRKSVV